MFGMVNYLSMVELGALMLGGVNFESDTWSTLVTDMNLVSK